MKEKEVKKSMKEKEVEKSKEVSLDLEDTKSVVKYKEHLRNLISIVKLEAEYEELMAKKMMMIVNQYRAADALNTYQSGVGKNEVEKRDKADKNEVEKRDKVDKDGVKKRDKVDKDGK